MENQTDKKSMLMEWTPMKALKTAGIVLVAVLLLGFPLVFKMPFPQHLMIMIFMFIILSQSWNLLAGYAGQVSIGHAVYFGFGAYGSVLLQLELGMSPWPAFFIGALVPIPLAILVGVPTFRLKGHYFAIATISVGEVVRILFQNWKWVGGNVGLYLPLAEEGFLNFQFHHDKSGYYYIGLFLAALTTYVIYLIQESKWGYYFRAIKGDQNAANALGIDPAKYKMLANIISSVMAGVAGAFFAQYVLFIDPFSVMASRVSVLVMLMAVLGGSGKLFGPIIGTFILIPISELSRVYWGGGGQAIDQVIYGALIILFAVFQPSGLLGIFSGNKNKRGAK